MLWRMSAEPYPDRIGIMLARLDNLPQRHRSVTLHAAAPDADFRTPMRCERISGRHDSCSRNFRPTPATPSHRRLAYRLRKLRELQNPGSGRPAPGLEIGISLAEIAETPTTTPNGVWRQPSLSEAEGSVGGSGNCANPLGCRYGRCSSNAVAGAGGVAESAETPDDDSPRRLASA